MHRRRTTGKASSASKSNTAAKTTKIHTVPSYKTCIIVVILSLLVVLLLVRYVGDRGGDGVVQRAQSLAYHGDLLQLRQLIEGHPDIDWQHLQRRLKTQSLIHTALFGRHSTIHSNELSGDHEVDY